MPIDIADKLWGKSRKFYLPNLLFNVTQSIKVAKAVQFQESSITRRKPDYPMLIASPIIMILKVGLTQPVILLKIALNTKLSIIALPISLKELKEKSTKTDPSLSLFQFTEIS